MKNDEKIDWRTLQIEAVTKTCLPDYIEAKAGELMELMRAKHEQYATPLINDGPIIDDGLTNFRAGANLAFGHSTYADMFEESKNYCRKHIAHVYGPEQDIGTEKIMESLGDIVIYSLIQMYMVELQQLEIESSEENE